MEVRKKSKNKSFRVLVAALCVLLIAVGTTVTTVVLTAGDSHGYNGGYVDGRQPTIAIGLSSGTATAAINSDGRLYIWGYGNDLGNGTGTTYVPTALDAQYSNKKWKSISMGNDHTLAIDENDYLYAWGSGTYGQLGNGGTTSTNIPATLHESVSDKKWKFAVAGGTASYAIDLNGYMFTWGRGGYSALGDGTTKSRNLPGALHESVSDKKWKSVASSYANPHVLALDEQGKLYAWGNNSRGQLGNGETSTAISIPQPIRHDKTWTAISAGDQFSTAIDDQGDIYTWGYAEHGRLGHGLTEVYIEEMNYTYYTLVDVYVPTLLVSDKKWKAVSAGSDHAFAIDTDGNIWGWGYNFHSKLGIPWVNGVDENIQYAPVQTPSMPSGSKWVEVVTAAYVSIAKNEAGEIYAWGGGSGNSPSLGLGADRESNTPTPEKVTMPAPVIVCPCCRVS